MDYPEEAQRGGSPQVPYIRRVLEPEVVEKRLPNYGYLALAIGIGVICVIAVAIIIPFFNLDLRGSIVLCSLVLAGYAIVLFFLLEPGILREVTHREIEFHKVPEIREVARPIYLEHARTRLNIPKYAYIGSSETKTYHKRGCRFSKLIRNKYKVSSNSQAFFKKRHYHTCDACFPKKKHRKAKR